MEKKNNKIAIVILNWNGAALMRRFLPSVVRYSPPDKADIIVADNGSTDDSLDMLRAEFSSVRIIRLDKNYGFAEGYNRALAQVSYPYCVLLNSDVEVTQGWLDAPLEYLEKDARIACIQPKILSECERNMFEYAGACGGFMDKYGYPFCRGRLLHIVEKDMGQYDTPADVLWVSGACFFIRTKVYRDAGGLDEGFFAHQEEIDLCWRLRARGYRLICMPRSKVYHVGGGTLNAESPRKTFLNFRNNLLMLYKNLPEEKLKKVMHVRFWLDYLAACKFLLTGHPRNAYAVYEARKAFRRLQPAYLPKRKENLRLAKPGQIPEWKPFSLLLRFYLYGKKHYSELPQ